MSTKYDYDAIVIGAGIGGLVCGCYLAKAGMKVLIVEKNAQPGGYCTSFKSGEHRFDACVHFLGSLREGGIVKKIMADLGIQNTIEILRADPSDTIYSKDYKFSYWNNIDKTINELQGYFPAQKKSIKEFFYYILKVEGYGFLRLRSKTLQDILNYYFTDSRLKGLLGVAVLGNTGVSPSRVSAIRAMTIYKEFMLDGGYYPQANVQIFPDTLMRVFSKYGGTIRLNSPVKKITLQDNEANGIMTKQGKSITGRYIISNADASHTFLDLIGVEHIPKTLQTTLTKLEPSLSMFALYLGIKKTMPHFPHHTNVWYLSDYNLENFSKYILSENIKDIK